MLCSDQKNALSELMSFCDIRSIVKSLFKATLLVLSGIFLAACGGDHYEANMTYQWSADRRSYKATAVDNSGRPCVEVVCHYLGKAPVEPIDKPIDRDWKTQSTDFYHYQLVNLVDEPIELRALHFRLKTGRGGRIYDTKGVDAIETELGGSVIQPHQFLERHNSWVFGKASQNTLHKIYEAYVGSERLRVDVPLVFSR